MRHRKRVVKLGRKSAHVDQMLAALVKSLIERKQIRTTLAKARLARSLADRLITLGKNGTLAARRKAIASLRNESAVTKLFSEIAPQLKDRKGGYTRIVKLGRRRSDGAEMAILEWVDIKPPERKPAKAEKVDAAAASGASK